MDPDDAVAAFRVGSVRLNARAYVVAVCAAAFVLWLRRPATLTEPSLWAEDGPVFLRTAYLESALGSIFDSYNGYWHLLLRVWAEVTSLLPVSAHAASLNAASLVSAALCYSLVLGRRLRWLIPSDTARAVAFVALVLLPGTGEITGTLTNALWPIAIALILLSLSEEPSSVWGRRGEIAAVVLTGLTGATSLLVWPSFALRWWRQRTRHNLVVAATVLACAAIQGLTLVTSDRAGAGFALELRTVVRAYLLRVWGTLAVGENTLTDVIGRPASLLLLSACAVGVVTTIVALIRLPAIARLQLLSVGALTVGATIWSFDGDLHEMSEATNAGRYYVVPSVLVVLAVIAAWSRAPRRWAQVAMAPAALLLAVAVVIDFAYPRLPSTHWAASAECIRAHRRCRVHANPPNFTFELPPVDGIR